MPYNLAVDRTVLAQRKFIAHILREKCSFIKRTVTLRFRPLFGALEAAYDVHLWLIGKRVVHFLLVIELFFARFYR